MTSTNTPSASITSTISTSKKSPGIILAARYRWSSLRVYIVNLIMYCTTQDLMPLFNIGPSAFIQYMLVLIVAGLPMLYMQVVIGQYTQQGSTYLKCMCPIFHGIGYVFMLSTVAHIVRLGISACDSLLYFCHSFRVTLPWLSCAEDLRDECWPMVACKERSCISANVLPASHVYWNRTFMQFNNMDQSSVVTRRFVMMLIVWGAVFVSLINMKWVSNRLMVWGYLVAYAVHVLTLFALSNYKGTNENGQSRWFNVHLDTMGSIWFWVQAVSNVNKLLCISNGGHILLGSYLESTTNSGLLSVLSSCLMSLVSGIIYAMSRAASIVLSKASNTDPETLANIPHFYDARQFTVIPGALGLISFAQFVSVGYFAASFVLAFTSIVVNLKVVEITLEDGHPKFIRYRKYIVFSIVLLCVVSSVPFVDASLFRFTNHDYGFILTAANDTISFLFLVMVSWIYGVQRLCDDVHFVTGSQPTTFWKICWFILPGVLSASCLLQIAIMINITQKMYNVLTFCVFCAPLAMAVVEIFRYMKRRNLIGLFQPDCQWGPPGAKHLRDMFNPRKETRSRRRNDCCQHNCLINSKILKLVAEEQSQHQMYKG